MATRETAPSLTNHPAHSGSTTETDSLEQPKEPRGPTAGAARFLSNRDSPPKQTCTRRHTGGSTHAESVDCQPRETIVNHRRQLSCETVSSLCGASPLWFTVCGPSWLMINSFRMRVASSVFPGACVRCGEFRFEVNIAAHAVGTLGSLGRSRRSVLVVCPEYLD